MVCRSLVSRITFISERVSHEAVFEAYYKELLNILKFHITI